MTSSSMEDDKTALRMLRNRIKNSKLPFAPDAEILIDYINNRGYESDAMNPRIFDVLHCAILRFRENMIDTETAQYYLRIMDSANQAVKRNYFTKKQTATLDKWSDHIKERCKRGTCGLIWVVDGGFDGFWRL